MTGAARGIGFATARRLAEAGADVAVNDVDADALDEAVGRLQSTGRRILALRADVSDLSTHAPMVATTVAELGSLDVLVNNAGTFQPTPLDDLDPDLVDQLYALNVKAVLFLSAEAAKVMGPGSSIINLSSLGGLRPPFPGLAAYHATKGAIDSLTRDMALDWGRRGIRVNGAGAGRASSPRAGARSPSTRCSRPSSSTRSPSGPPAGRWGGWATPTTWRWPSSSWPARRPGFITGQQLLVDGGYFYA